MRLHPGKAKPAVSDIVSNMHGLSLHWKLDILTCLPQPVSEARQHVIKGKAPLVFMFIPGVFPLMILANTYCSTFRSPSLTIAISLTAGRLSPAPPPLRSHGYRANHGIIIALDFAVPRSRVASPGLLLACGRLGSQTARLRNNSRRYIPLGMLLQGPLLPVQRPLLRAREHDHVPRRLYRQDVQVAIVRKLLLRLVAQPRHLRYVLDPNDGTAVPQLAIGNIRNICIMPS